MNDITQLRHEVEELKSRLIEASHESTLWKDKYESLLEQFKLFQQRQFAPSSEKNLAQQDFFDEAGIDLPEPKNEESQSNTIDVPAHKRTKAKRAPLPKSLPREEIVHDIEEAKKICDCGCEKERFGEEVTEQLKVIPPKLSVVCHIRPKYACRKCESAVSIAAMPKLLLPKSNATPSLITFIILNKYCDHLPLYRQEQIWKRYNIDIPRNTMCGWLLSVAELCEPLWKQLRLYLLAHDYIQADETTLQVMKESERKNTQKSYAWVYKGGCVKQKVVVYEYQETRAGLHARNFLKGFKGYLQTDGYKGYDWVDDIEEIIHLGCMAHARRPFAELVKLIKKPGKAHQALAFIQKLYKVEKEARDNGLTPEERQALRDKKSKPILNPDSEFNFIKNNKLIATEY